MEIVLTQIAKTSILEGLNKSQDSKKYNMADIKEIVFWGRVIEITTRDNKVHLVLLKIG